MNRTAPEIWVCQNGLDVCIRIRGRADVSVSVGFKELLSGLLERNFEHYELELSDCQIMDSTFLGVLCGFAQKREVQTLTDPSRPIMFNANERVTGLLHSLGVEEMFDFRSGKPADKGRCEPAPTLVGNPDRERLKATSLEAHRTLMSLNPDNIPKFKDLTKFLAEDLKRMGNQT